MKATSPKETITGDKVYSDFEKTIKKMEHHFKSLSKAIIEFHKAYDRLPKDLKDNLKQKLWKVQ